ncbi:hypothetical protein LZ32DRAFT_626915 [Colletotrichum eremochloae]|nr:hypothetical protein LZ32DRAFT_626915 [Colletotrichum eremochloae]
MSSSNRNGNLPNGAFITTFNGKRCTARPRAGNNTRSNNQEQRSTSTSQSTSTSTSTSIPTSTSTSTSIPTSTSTSTPQSIPPPETSAPPPVVTTTTAAPPPPPPPPPPSSSTTQPPAVLTTTSASTTSSSSPLPALPLPVTTPSSITPPAPVVPSPPPAASTTSLPSIVDAEPPATIPTFNNIPNIPVQSVPPTPAQLPPPASSSSSVPVPVVLPPAPGTSQTDANAVPTPPAAETSPAFLSDANPSPSPTSSAGTDLGPGVGAIAPSTPLNPGTAAGEASNDSPGSSGTPPGNSRSGVVPTPVVIASSVAGAVVFLGLLGLLIWFWRKRLFKRRRSTLLTPLSTEPGFRHAEKAPYIIDRASLGPTPRSAKLKAALGYNFQRFLGQLGALVSPNRDSSPTRDRSQFMNVSQHSRNSSSLSNHMGPRDVVTTKDRVKDWWERLTADMNFNWRLRGNGNVDKDTFVPARDVKDRKAATGGQPDFLTLLGMDDREVEREAQRRHHFLGGLGLNFDNAAANPNPFSDANAVRHDSVKPGPLAVANPDNDPFSDVNAISAPAAAAKPPSTYVADVRRPPSGSTYSPRPDSMYRDSVQSVESFATRRNKFRSDPFDLERPELLGSRTTQASSNYSQASSGAPRVPGSYSSGVSMDGWSDPGPDVGPLNGPSYRYETESPVAGYRSGEQRMLGRRPSGGSQNSVGKAL